VDWRCTKCVYIRDILDILNTMLTWRCTKCVTSRYGKCHNMGENEIGELYTILSLDMGNVFDSSLLKDVEMLIDSAKSQHRRPLL
jgi:hypothetical protein